MGENDRPKGFVDWNPRPETLALIAKVGNILDQYASYGPMTVRQIFYRLVGQYGYEKTDLAYNRLAEHMVRARRAQMIPFNRIREDKTKTYVNRGGDTSPEQWWDDLDNLGSGYERPREYGQEVALELWCEAGGMGPMLAQMVRPYGVDVYSTGGFSSVTVTRNIALRAAQRKVPTVFLHVGDYDPSGESIFEAMSNDAQKFFYQSRHWEGDVARTLDLSVERVALTEEQVEEYALPTKPPKAGWTGRKGDKGDSRTGNWVGETCEAEALAPSDLETIIVSAVERHFDMDVYRRNLEREERERRLVSAQWDALMEYRDDAFADAVRAFEADENDHLEDDDA